jgi:hypothetical protein
MRQFVISFLEVRSLVLGKIKRSRSHDCPLVLLPN